MSSFSFESMDVAMSIIYSVWVDDWREGLAAGGNQLFFVFAEKGEAFRRVGDGGMLGKQGFPGFCPVPLVVLGRVGLAECGIDRQGGEQFLRRRVFQEVFFPRGLEVRGDFPGGAGALCPG